MDPCTIPGRDIIRYKVNLQTESIVDTESIYVASCTDRRCGHTFQLPSTSENGSFPLSYDSVSVAAENMAGVGAVRSCSEQTISELSYRHFLLPCK